MTNRIKARLRGGDMNGLVIELPEAFRGIDVQRGRKVARYRYGGEDDQANPFYVYRSDRRGFAGGAVRIPVEVPVDDEVTVAGIGYYPP
jgi:hypothetical protein